MSRGWGAPGVCAPGAGADGCRPEACSRVCLAVAGQVWLIPAHIPLILVLRYVVELAPRTNLTVVGGVCLLCSLLWGLREARDLLRVFHGLEFGPPEAPDRFRIVGPGSAGRWRRNSPG